MRTYFPSLNRFSFFSPAVLLFLLFLSASTCFASVSIITPSAYTVSNLNVGDTYYLDRTYTVTSIPTELATGAEEWIKTQNNDKSNTTSSNFLQFTTKEDAEKVRKRLEENKLIDSLKEQISHDKVVEFLVREAVVRNS